MGELLRIVHRCAGAVTRHVHDVGSLPSRLRTFVEEAASLCRPDAVHVCDGSEAEQKRLLLDMERSGTLRRLPKYRNCWLARTDPKDVARVESRTFVVTPKRRDAVPEAPLGGSLGNWMSPADMEAAVRRRFPGCMKGRTMYVVPFSMGPLASPLAKLGVQLTDSPYVVVSMRVMTRMGTPVLEQLESEGGQDFVRCLHSVGGPLGVPWPCDPDQTLVLQRPDTREIVSFGSGYGGNSLLGKKCLALRLGSAMAAKEGWLAEHMLLVGVTPPSGRKRYLAAAFPSACGKTNLAMLRPTLPGYKVECVGDDIAWMRFDGGGRLRAVNPENGFFGVAPGTSQQTNPHAMASIFSDTIFTNVASTEDGGVYWEGLEPPPKGAGVTDWLGKPWTEGCGRPAAHPNSRFCSPARNCPVMDPLWEDPEGVPVDAVVFGGRRPAGVPLVVEARSWRHGVLMGAALRSEATAAAEHKGKVVMHDPFAMRPFLGLNFGDYLRHWLSLQDLPQVKLPKVFQVNWFRRADEGKGPFLWPGFGENSRVLDWILRRLDDEDVAQDTAVGLIPKPGTLNLEGLKEPVDVDQLFSLPRDFWLKEVAAVEDYFREHVGKDLPPELSQELKDLKERVTRSLTQ